MKTNRLNYANLWKLLKEGKSLKLKLHKDYVRTVVRMISKHKYNDVAYKLLNLANAKIYTEITPVEGEPLKVWLFVTLKQYPTNWSCIMED